MPDIPVPYNLGLMNSVLPREERIAEKMEQLRRF